MPGVAALPASTSAECLPVHALQVQQSAKAARMFKATLGGEIEAVPFSAPTWLHFASHAGSGQVKSVGPELHKTELAFAAPIDSSSRREIDPAPLTMREDGSCAQICHKCPG